jgi:murein DD-endopeptidase MepM/ murein hydrolase activator NlpD
MSKIKYYYNTDTCKYEPAVYTPKKLVLNLFSYLAVALVLASGLIYVYQQNFTPIKESKLATQNEQIKSKWGVLEQNILEANKAITQLQIKDDSIYRTILDIAPLAPTARQAGIGGSPRYEELIRQNLEQEQLIVNTYQRIDKMKKKLYIQTLSYDEIVEIEKEKEKMWAAKPAIQPINNKELKRLHTTYGQRFHPILGIWRPHKALDFTAPVGTPIYATGDGVAQRANFSKSYGNVVYLDHGYGYKTRYAHLSKFNIVRGQKVKRGDIIGYVGNTGLSAAAHLHYEVLYKNEQINPIDFFHRDLSVEEYEKLLNLVDDDAPSLDSH